MNMLIMCIVFGGTILLRKYMVVDQKGRQLGLETKIPLWKCSL